jgi:hypothetical protein
MIARREQVDNRWCLASVVSVSFESQTVCFVVDEAGQFVETADCRRSLLAIVTVCDR